MTDTLHLDDTRTLAEMTVTEKRRISHRGKALVALRAAHEQGLPAPVAMTLE